MLLKYINWIIKNLEYSIQRKNVSFHFREFDFFLFIQIDINFVGCLRKDLNWVYPLNVPLTKSNKVRLNYWHSLTSGSPTRVYPPESLSNCEDPPNATTRRRQIYAVRITPNSVARSLLISISSSNSKNWLCFYFCRA